VHAAAAKGHLEILELLLARGADPLKREWDAGDCVKATGCLRALPTQRLRGHETSDERLQHPANTVPSNGPSPRRHKPSLP